MDKLVDRPTIKPVKNSLLVFILLFLGAAAAVFLNGRAAEGAQGVFLLAAGAGLLLSPPQFRVEGRLWACLAVFLFFCSLALLPQSWFPVPGWREHLQGLPIPLGKQLSPVPTETIFYLGLLAGSGVLCLLGLSHPFRSSFLLFLASAVVFVCLLYAGLAIYSLKTGWTYPFDEDASFGFFPNRNQTATFLVTGCLVALGILGVVGKNGKWGHGLVAATGLGGCGTALLVYSESRGGVVFLVAGTFLWVLGLGRAYWSKSLIISFLGIFLATMILFLVSKGEARNRILKSVGIGAISPDMDAQNSLGISKEVTAEGRIRIYKDTWQMICDHPVTGIGLGAYRYIYHFYQKESLTESTSVHPESDWLMLAAECGIPSLVVATVGGWFLFSRIRTQNKHSYWPLRWGFICAALIAILHGIVDVPVHRMALGWWILVLMCAGLQIFPEKEARPFFWQRLVFWVTGLCALLLGIFLIRADWYNGISSPPFKADRAADRIYEIYKADPVKASQFATSAILESPMSEGLYDQKALILLSFDGTEPEVDSYFAAERALNPTWPRVSMSQGAAWINLDPDRVYVLWADALERMRRIDTVNGTGLKGTLALYEKLMRESEKYPEVQRRLYMAAEQKSEMTLVWLQIASPALVTEQLPQISQDAKFLAALEPKQRQLFLENWYRKGDRVALFEFAELHPDWKEAFWPLTIRRLIDAKNFQEAVGTVAEHYHLDLSLPARSLDKKLSLPDESENPVVNFEYFWKAGNEVTARRILEEARVNAEKSGRLFPKIWQKSTALARHDEKWDLAWVYLQLYLRDSGQTEAFWER